MTDTDKRKFKRLSVEMVSHLRKTNETAPLGIAKDISEGGVFLETHKKFKPGDIIEFDMLIPQGNQKVAVTGIVRWTKGHEPFGVGLEFTKVTVDNRIRLKRHLKELLRKKNHG